MPAGKDKSRSQRKVFVKLPGGSTKMTRKPRKPSAAKCAACGGVLTGTPRLKDMEMAKLSKTQRRPERPYGGNLCSKCSKRKIISENR